MPERQVLAGGVEKNHVPDEREALAAFLSFKCILHKIYSSYLFATADFRRSGATYGPTGGPGLGGPATQATSAASRSAAGRRAVPGQWAEEAGGLGPEAPPRLRQPPSSGYVCSRFRRAAASTAWPGRTLGPGCASPLRVTGLTMVTSTATFAPLHRERRWPPPCVSNGHIDIHICQSHVVAYPPSRFPADTGKRAVKRQRARGQDTGRGARRPVVTQGIQGAMAAAGAERQLQRECRGSSRNWAGGMRSSATVGFSCEGTPGPVCDSTATAAVLEMRRQGLQSASRALVTYHGRTLLQPLQRVVTVAISILPLWHPLGTVLARCQALAMLCPSGQRLQSRGGRPRGFQGMAA